MDIAEENELHLLDVTYTNVDRESGDSNLKPTKLIGKMCDIFAKNK